MDDLGNVVAEAVKAAVPKSIDAAASNLTEGISKNVGDTLADLWFLAFGGISHRAEKRKLSYGIALQQFEERSRLKVAAIPEKDRGEPSTQIVMNILHDAESCVEEEVLREMFSNLIASSMNSKTASFVHASFSTMIRQFSTTDAIIMENFAHVSQFPIANIVRCPKEFARHCLVHNVLHPQTADSREDIIDRSSSLVFLANQGLIELDYENYIDVEAYYAPHRQFLELIGKELSLGVSYASRFNIRSDKIQYPCVRYERGIASLTDFGARFVKTCIPIETITITQSN